MLSAPVFFQFFSFQAWLYTGAWATSCGQSFSHLWGSGPPSNQAAVLEKACPGLCLLIFVLHVWAIFYLLVMLYLFIY